MLINKIPFLSTTSAFGSSALPRGLFAAPSIPRPIFSVETPPRPVTPIQTPTPKTPEPIIRPPPAPIARRLSVNSLDTFTDELYQQMIDSIIQETTYNIFEYDQ